MKTVLQIGKNTYASRAVPLIAGITRFAGWLGWRIAAAHCSI
jgi:hypothetical protein